MKDAGRLFGKFGLLLIMMGICSQAASLEPHVPYTPTLRISINDWTGQHLSSHIIGEVLKKAGYQVQYVEVEYLKQIKELTLGNLDFVMEVWATTGKEVLDEGLKTGNIESFSDTGLMSIEEWWYPLYMKEKCPKLPDWRALNDCAELFATPETAPLGRYLGGPVSWGGYDEERIEALGLNYKVEHVENDAQLYQELDVAYKAHQPILLWIYAPYWIPNEYAGEWVEFPRYQPECYTNPSWGINPKKTHDCGKPRGPIWRVVSKHVIAQYPKAYKIFRAFRLNNYEMSRMVKQVDVHHEKIEDVVAAWMQKNTRRWQAWLN